MAHQRQSGTVLFGSRSGSPATLMRTNVLAPAFALVTLVMGLGACDGVDGAGDVSTADTLSNEVVDVSFDTIEPWVDIEVDTGGPDTAEPVPGVLGRLVSATTIATRAIVSRVPRAVSVPMSAASSAPMDGAVARLRAAATRSLSASMTTWAIARRAAKTPTVSTRSIPLGGSSVCRWVMKARVSVQASARPMTSARPRVAVSTRLRVGCASRLRGSASVRPGRHWSGPKATAPTPTRSASVVVSCVAAPTGSASALATHPRPRSVTARTTTAMV